jgi:hypothetical protein
MFVQNGTVWTKDVAEGNTAYIYHFCLSLSISI